MIEIVRDNGGRGKIMETLLERYPRLEVCKEAIHEACDLIIRCYIRGGMVLTCGNGGSAADSAHIVGELMKGFRRKRSLTDEFVRALASVDEKLSSDLAGTLQMPLAAVDLTAQAALGTAFSNDQSATALFAQQVLGYGRPENLLIGLSTSGNSKNVVYAAFTARALGLATIGLTGSSGGELAGWCDVLIAVPETDTASVQELHLPVYHAICSIVEAHFFET